jgi:hypothetical protein
MADFGSGSSSDYENKWCNLYIDTNEDPIDNGHKVPDNWVNYTESIYPDSDFLESNNTGYIAPSGYPAEVDKESDPIHPSTAKIRDEQMTSLWELGCIHRGEPWRTINLKGCTRQEVNKGRACFPTDWRRNWQMGQFRDGGGGLHEYDARISGLYSDGDSDLLDQIKMTDEAFTYPQIAVGNPNPDYWEMVTRFLKSDAIVENKHMGAPGRKYYPWRSEMEDDFLESFFTLDGENSKASYQSFFGNCLHGKNGVPFLFVNINNTGFGGQTGHMDEWNWRDVSQRGTDVPSNQFLGFIPYEIGKENLDTRDDDFYQEEHIGKVSDLIKLRGNIYRSIISVQLLAKIPKMQARLIEKIYKNDEDDPRVLNYVNVYSFPGECGLPGYGFAWESSLGHHWDWYRIEGEQKMMIMLKRNPEAHIFEAISKEVLENDY